MLSIDRFVISHLWRRPVNKNALPVKPILNSMMTASRPIGTINNFLSSVAHTQLAARGADILAFAVAYDRRVVLGVQLVLKGDDCGIVGALEIAAVERVERDQVDFGGNGAQKARQAASMIGAVVEPID
jgi:hypothetical protein